MPWAAAPDPQLCAAALVRSTSSVFERGQGALRAEGVCVGVWEGDSSSRVSGTLPVPAAGRMPRAGLQRLTLNSVLPRWCAELFPILPWG